MMGREGDGIAECFRHSIAVPGNAIELAAGEPPLEQGARREGYQEYQRESVQCVSRGCRFRMTLSDNASPRLLDFPEVYREVMKCHKTRRI